MEGTLIQYFPLRGGVVYLRIRKRRWRHKTAGEIIKTRFQLRSRWFKIHTGTIGFFKRWQVDAHRYHQQHSELLPGE